MSVGPVIIAGMSVEPEVCGLADPGRVVRGVLTPNITQQA